MAPLVPINYSVVGLREGSDGISILEKDKSLSVARVIDVESHLLEKATNNTSYQSDFVQNIFDAHFRAMLVDQVSSRQCTCGKNCRAFATFPIFEAVDASSGEAVNAMGGVLSCTIQIVPYCGVGRCPTRVKQTLVEYAAPPCFLKYELIGLREGSNGLLEQDDSISQKRACSFDSSVFDAMKNDKQNTAKLIFDFFYRTMHSSLASTTKSWKCTNCDGKCNDFIFAFKYVYVDLLRAATGMAAVYYTLVVLPYCGSDLCKTKNHNKLQEWISQQPRGPLLFHMPYCGNCKKADIAFEVYCQRCETTAYCSRECQSAHGDEHKKMCPTLKDHIIGAANAEDPRQSENIEKGDLKKSEPDVLKLSKDSDKNEPLAEKMVLNKPEESKLNKSVDERHNLAGKKKAATSGEATPSNSIDKSDVSMAGKTQTVKQEESKPSTNIENSEPVAGKMDPVTDNNPVRPCEKPIIVFLHGTEYCERCGTRSDSLKVCQCLDAIYCNRDCQNAHWKIHRKSCCKENPKLKSTMAYCACCERYSKLRYVCLCSTTYCSRRCRKAHLEIHKKSCSKFHASKN